jgi:2-oxoglutarate dehydrogenase E2 component (dihydrolipoamide succinyltransferase)
MGESIFEGTITKWLKKPGDKVERDEPLFEISTDKVDAEIPSPSAGVLKEIKVKEGQTVPINTVVASIDAAGSAAATPARPAAPAPAPAPKAEAAKPAAAPVMQPATSKPGPVPVPSPQAPAQPAVAASAPAKEGARIHSSPLVRRMAKEHGIDLSTVPGTGAGGRISKQDIEAAIAGGGSLPSPFEPAEESAYSGPPQSPRPAVVPPPAPAYAPAAAPAGHGTQYIPSLQTGVPRERLYFGNY